MFIMHAHKFACCLTDTLLYGTLLLTQYKIYLLLFIKCNRLVLDLEFLTVWKCLLSLRSLCSLPPPVMTGPCVSHAVSA